MNAKTPVTWGENKLTQSQKDRLYQAIQLEHSVTLKKAFLEMLSLPFTASKVLTFLYLLARFFLPIKLVIILAPVFLAPYSISYKAWRKTYKLFVILPSNIIKYSAFSSNLNTKRYWDKKLLRFGNFWRDEHYHHILDLFPKDRAFSLLDIGCALGDGCELLQKEFPKAKITGVDISRVGIVKAKQKTKRVEYFTIDILRDQLPGKYDYITIIETLEHFDDPFFVVDKCLEHVRKSLIISTPYSPRVPSGRIQGFRFREHRYAFDEKTFANYNCRVVRMTEFIKSTNANCIIYEIGP